MLPLPCRNFPAPPPPHTQGHTDGLCDAALSPDESRLATASFDGSARVWDMATGECCEVLPHTAPLCAVYFSP